MSTTYHPPAIIAVEDSMEASRILRAEWHECKTCGAYVANADSDSICDPKKVKWYKAYLAREAKAKVIRARMEARRLKYEEMQAKDDWALYQLRQGDLR